MLMRKFLCNFHRCFILRRLSCVIMPPILDFIIKRSLAPTSTSAYGYKYLLNDSELRTMERKVPAGSEITAFNWIIVNKLASADLWSLYYRNLVNILCEAWFSNQLWLFQFPICFYAVLAYSSWRISRKESSLHLIVSLAFVGLFE